MHNFALRMEFYPTIRITEVDSSLEHSNEILYLFQNVSNHLLHTLIFLDTHQPLVIFILHLSG